MRAMAPATSRERPSPIDCESPPTACSPTTLPIADATVPVASAVARARVGKSSPDQAPRTGVAALANELQRTLPARNPTAPVPKLRLAASALAAVRAAPGSRRPNRSLRNPPATYDAGPATPETTH